MEGQSVLLARIGKKDDKNGGQSDELLELIQTSELVSPLPDSNMRTQRMALAISTATLGGVGYVDFLRLPFHFTIPFRDDILNLFVDNYVVMFLDLYICILCIRAPMLYTLSTDGNCI